MDKKIGKTLTKVFKDTQTASSPSPSKEIETLLKTLGAPNCPHCGGAGFVRVDVPLGHEKFGRLESCICRSQDVAKAARERLFALSNLDRLSHLNFGNFLASGNEKAKFMTPLDIDS